MWEQLRNKFKKLFESDINHQTNQDDHQQQDTQQTKNKNIQTRMSYRYPSNDESLKFPVSPITTSHDKSKRKRVREFAEDNQTVIEDKRTFEKTKPIKHNKDSDLKFKPSEVPSPIYGFQHRPKEDEEDRLEVPAYIRKDHLSSNEMYQEIISEQESIEPVEPVEEQIIESMNEMPESVEQTDYNLQPNTNIEDKLEDNYEDVNNVNSHIDQKNSNETSQYDQPSPQFKEENQSRTETRRNPKNNRPFNVLMTPRDKKLSLQRQQQRQEQQHRQKPPQKKEQEHMGDTVPLHLLNDRVETCDSDNGWVEDQKDLLETTLKHFHIDAKVVGAVRGPSVTRFEIQPEPGVKVSKVKNLSDDIKLNLAAKDIRIEAPIPGKNTIGIEVPNPVSQAVMLQQLFESKEFQRSTSPLTVALGLDIAGNPILTDLNKMPHGLIAGATGSGKSVCINTILISLLYKANHQDVRFLLIDPKMVELAPYNDLPHLVSPVITDVKAATKALKWAVTEMEDRYQKFVHEGARDIERFNQKMEFQNREDEKLPYLVIVIDELADLMMVSPHDVEDAICRIAQKARAAGIHLLLATQRPSVDVITGLIKSNIPTRIAFSVASQVDSRTMIDTSGAEQLLGKGDMLFVENGARQAVRIQGAFVSDEEIERVTAHIKKIAPPDYLFEQEQLIHQVDAEEEEDEIYHEAVTFVVQENKASASLLQRRFKIGYNRAARLIDHMETTGIISEQKGSKSRDVLVSEQDLNEITH